MAVRRVVSLVTIIIFASALFGYLKDDLEFGKKMYRDGYNSEALYKFQNIIKYSPEAPEAEEATYLAAEIHRKAEDYAEAIKLYQSFCNKYQRSLFLEEARYYLGLSYFLQKDYIEATTALELFIDSYQNSQFLHDAYYTLIESYLGSNSYELALKSGRNYINKYPNGEKKPDIMLSMIRSYLGMNAENDASNTLEMIINNFPFHNARWEAIGLKSEIIEKTKGKREAIQFLVNQISDNMPRQYEEIFRKKLVELYLKESNLTNAKEQLDILLKRFDRSDYLFEYIFTYTKILIELRKYSEVIAFSLNFEEQDFEDQYYLGYLINLAEAYYYLGKYNKTEEELSRLKGQLNIENAFREKYWKARLKESSNEYQSAIEMYQNLAASSDSIANKLDLQMRIGDIYLEGLAMYRTAIRYYDQVAINAGAKSDLYWKALYKISLCYQAMGDYQTALNYLTQVNPNQIKNELDKQEYFRMTDLLSDFKIQNYQEAFAELVKSLYVHTVSSDKDALNEQILKILLNNINDYTSVLSILKDDQTVQGHYLRGKAYAKALYKANLENKGSERQGIIEKINQSIEYLKKHNQEKYAQELNIEKEYLSNNQRMDTQLLSEIENFLGIYPNAEVSDLFSFYVGEHYLSIQNYSKADQCLTRIKSMDYLPKMRLERTLIVISSYYFDNGQYEKVVNYLGRIADHLTLSDPELLYRYATSLIKIGNKKEGLGKVELLVKNTREFTGYTRSLDLLAQNYRIQKDYNKTIYFMEKYPAEDKNASYYQALSEDYLNLGDRVKAKEALMYIEDKDNTVLAKLADLHYQTGDLIMAEYTYKELIRAEKNQKDKLSAQSRLAHIYFISEEWRNSVEEYDEIIDKLGEKVEVNQYSYLNFVQIAKEAVISLYRTQNRPKAEAVQKRFQTILNKNEEALFEIEISKGIYLMDINRSQAEKTFSDLLKKANISDNIRYHALFWRGVNYLELKKTDDANKDFEGMLNTNDPDLRNQAYFKLGTISFSKEKYQQALDYYYAVIQSDQEGNLAIDAAKNYAIVCKTIEDWQKAVEAYEIILERWGNKVDRPEILSDLGYSHFRNRNYKEAIDYFRQVIGMVDNIVKRAETQYWIGESYFHMGNYEAAIAEFRSVAMLGNEVIEWAATSSIRIAEAYIKQEDFKAAKGELDRIISKYGRGSDWGKQASILLEKL